MGRRSGGSWISGPGDPIIISRIMLITTAGLADAQNMSLIISRAVLCLWSWFGGLPFDLPLVV